MFQKNGIIAEPVNVVATAAGTTTLVSNTLTSATLGKQIQIFELINQSTGSLTVNFNGGAAFTDASGVNYSTINHNVSMFVILQTNGTTAGTWAVLSSTTGAIGSPGPTIQKFTSSSGTYTTPANVAYIHVRMVGGGGGASGSGGAGGKSGN